MKMLIQVMMSVAVAVGFTTPAAAAAIRFTGVNLFGAEFGESVLPGTYGQHYIYPNQTEVEYFRGKGMNTIRLPFRWERLQRSTNAALNTVELGRMNTFVSAATVRGMFVILEPHNFARYFPEAQGGENFQTAAIGRIGNNISYASFADFWRRVAEVYRTNDHVFFNLMNEPNTMPTEDWVTAANAAIAAIRGAGATNLILVPGNQWTGAWSWSMNFYGTPNSVALLNIVDPANNHAFEVHQYLDGNSSGSSTNIVNANIGVQRLANFTQWLRTYNKRGFLGEFAVAASMIGGAAWQIGDEDIDNTLGHLEANADVWLGWTWWAAGPWYTEYMFSLEPIGGDRSQMSVLREHVPIPSPVLTLTGGSQFRFVAPPGFIFQPEGSRDLAPGGWSNHGSPITGDGQTVTINLSTGTDTRSFYRVRVNRAP
jgi:endoglucanase